jgi:hypothetical protein
MPYIHASPEHPLQPILQRGVEPVPGAPGQQRAYCRTMDCWAACAAMVARPPDYRGGTLQLDSDSIDTIKDTFPPRGPTEPGVGDAGLPSELHNRLALFVNHTLNHLPTANDAPYGGTYVRSIREIFRLLEASPMLVMNNWVVSRRVGNQVVNQALVHVTVFTKVEVTTTGALADISEEEARAAYITYVDPWPYRRNGTALEPGGAENYRVPFDWNPDSGFRRQTLVEYMSRYFIASWSEARALTALQAAPQHRVTTRA